MTGFLKVIGLLAVVLHCNGLSKRQQPEKYVNNEAVFRLKSGRRFALPQGSVIIGAPSYPSHLPEAEPILPGHTLIRPGLGMLKSAVKFPHRELEGGSGVYGNWDNIGIRYDGRNERVLYTGFRRSNSNSNDPIVVILPSEPIRHRTKTIEDTQNELLSRIIQDMLNDAAKLRNPQSRFGNTYSSEEIRKSRQDNGKDKYQSFMLKGGVQKNELNQAMDKNLKSLNLKKYAQTNYINSIIDTIKSLRRYKIEEENETKNKTREQRKQEWFWQTKDAGNHIQFSEKALDFTDLLPIPKKKDLEQIQSWWYYNQADYTELQEKRRHE